MVGEVSADELAGMLKDELDFVLELYVLTESKLCTRPVYKFMKAYTESEDDFEFCMVYREIDDPGEIYISVNSKNPETFENITRRYRPCAIVFYGECGSGELRQSFYRRGGPGKKHTASNTDFTLLSPRDKNLQKSFEAEADCYLNTIFCDFAEKPIYNDCGIIGAYDKDRNFVGYLAYYEIAKNIRDVSYIYVGEAYRGRGYGRALLNFFADKNADENKISYYSFADGEISKHLVLSCGFLPCALRREYEPS